jgi:nucleoside 2-deoxyribosyltransferase
MSNDLPSVYLAGPAVFRPNANELANEWKRYCSQVGLQGEFPLDAEITGQGLTGPEFARKIFEANINLIRSCRGVIADLSPFRGPSADVGTAFEVGFAHGLNLPIVAWSAVPNTYIERLRALGSVVGTDGSKPIDNRDATTIENFDLCDNLMICVPLRGRIVHPTFHDAAKAMAEVLKR